jgi:hypothetical protein
MSTPSGKPGPVDFSTHSSQREGDESEQNATANDEAPFHSPYAPKQTHQRPAAGSLGAAHAGPPVANDETRRERPAFGEIPMPRPVDLDAAASTARRPAPAQQPAASAPVAKRPGEAFSDRDIERLESSLRWLQREETAARLLHTPARLPRAPTLPEAEANADDFDSPLPRRLKSPRSLEPEFLPPPPDLNTGWGHWPFSILLASAVGAGVAYYVASGEAPQPASAPRPQIVAFDAKPAVPPLVTTRRTEVLPTVARDDEPTVDAPAEPPPEAKTVTKTTRLANLSERAATPAPAPVEVAPPAPRPAARTLDAEEIKLLVDQGEQFVASGDLVTARTVFQRAAEAGDAGAAMALAATYDPIMLAKLGVVGMNADVEKARSWYEKAASLGSSEAKRRLGQLANR